MRVAAHTTVETWVACGTSRAYEGATFINVCLAVNSIVPWRALADKLVGLDLTRSNTVRCSLEDSAMIVMAHALAVLTRVEKIRKWCVGPDADNCFHLNVRAVFIFEVDKRRQVDINDEHVVHGRVLQVAIRVAHTCHEHTEIGRVEPEVLLDASVVSAKITCHLEINAGLVIVGGLQNHQ